MADLGMTSATIHQKVQEVWDWGDDDATEQAEALFHMNSAYQRIVEGIHPKDGAPHLWSWLRKSSTITLVVGTTGYALAADFDGLFPGEDPVYNHVANKDYPELKPISLKRWLELTEPANTADRDTPYAYCVTNVEPYVAATGQRYQMNFYPAPDEALTVNYSYRQLVTALADDANYPMGGPKIGSLVYYGALAEMEKKDGTFDGPWEGMFLKCLAAAIETDSYFDHTLPQENHLDTIEIGVWY